MEDESQLRVFVQSFKSSNQSDSVCRSLIMRAHKMKLPLEHGIFATSYHPTTKLFVMILTITVPQEKK
jgi:hypothetical protein